MATGNESKIDTKLFAATAETLYAVTGELNQCFEEWAGIMQSLRGEFQGDTADDIKNTADAVMNSASILLLTLGGYRKTLNEMAGIYDKTEKAVQEAGKSLSFDKKSMV